ncbi:MAG TPA: nuclear transport factor 2 family protein [Chryseolinea sp.]
MKVAKKINAFEMLSRLYSAFNEKDVDKALEVIHPDAVWANSMEGGLAKGHQEIRDYWMRQWSYIQWHVQPKQLQKLDSENFVVQAHQIIRDLSGNIVSIRNLEHIFHIENGFITTMSIR